jgi:hypothetical protein
MIFLVGFNLHACSRFSPGYLENPPSPTLTSVVGSGRVRLLGWKLDLGGARCRAPAATAAQRGRWGRREDAVVAAPLAERGLVAEERGRGERGRVLGEGDQDRLAPAPLLPVGSVASIDVTSRMGLGVARFGLPVGRSLT